MNADEIKFKQQSNIYFEVLSEDLGTQKEYESILTRKNSLPKFAKTIPTPKLQKILEKFIKNPDATRDSKEPVIETKIQQKVKSIRDEITLKFEALQTDAFKLYKASAIATLAMKILGPTEMRSNNELLANVGMLHTPPHSPVELEEVSSHEKYAGAILCDEKWNILKNDAALLGAIHTQQPVHVCYTFDEMMKLDDKELHNGLFLRVVFREILQLQAAGYRMIDQPNPLLSNVILVSSEEEKAISFTFSDMLKAVENITTAAEVREKIQLIPKIAYGDYSMSCLASPYERAATPAGCLRVIEPSE